MKYIKSFILFLLISILFVVVSEIIDSIPPWEKLPDVPSRAVKLKGIHSYSGVYYNIVVESENEKTYIFNDSDEIWLEEALFTYSIDTTHNLMFDCVPDDPKILKLIEGNIEIHECYQYFVQYNHDAADLIVVLDQDGSIWQNHEFLNPTPISALIAVILLFTFILEILYLIFEGLRSILIKLIKKDVR